MGTVQHAGHIIRRPGANGPVNAKQDRGGIMRENICGADCGQCAMKEACKGCLNTNGHPFGGNCVVAACCRERGYGKCAQCAAPVCDCKARLMEEFNALGIKDMPPVTELYSLSGAFINLAYPLPGGQAVKFWRDEDVYLGAQLPKGNSGRCYGLAASAEYLMVSEYGENGSEPELVLFKRR